MMIFIDQETEDATNDCNFVCGEIFSPSEHERGKIYVGGTIGEQVLSNSLIDFERHMDYADFPSLRSKTVEEKSNAYDSVQKSVERMRKNKFWCCDYDNFSVGINSLEECPQCKGPLICAREEEEKSLPPYCAYCKAFFVTEAQGESEMLGNLVDSLLQNNLGHNPKGSIVFLDNQFEDESHTYFSYNSVRHKRGKSCSYDEDKFTLNEKAAIEEEQRLILSDIRKIQIIAEMAINKTIADYTYSFAKDMNGGDSQQLRCVICRMPLMEKKGRGTFCVTCPKIRSIARKHARKRMEEKEALSQIQLNHNEVVNKNGRSFEECRKDPELKFTKSYETDQKDDYKKKNLFDLSNLDEGEFGAKNMEEGYLEKMNRALQFTNNAADPNYVHNLCEGNYKYATTNDDKYYTKDSNEESGLIPTIALVDSDDSNECRINWVKARSKTQLGSEGGQNIVDKMTTTTLLNNSRKSILGSIMLHSKVDENFVRAKAEEESTINSYSATLSDRGTKGDSNQEIVEDNIEACGPHRTNSSILNDENGNHSRPNKIERVHSTNNKIDCIFKEKINEQYEKEFHKWNTMRKPFFEILHMHRTFTTLKGKQNCFLCNEMNEKKPHIIDNLQCSIEHEVKNDTVEQTSKENNVESPLLKSQHGFINQMAFNRKTRNLSLEVITADSNQGIACDEDTNKNTTDADQIEIVGTSNCLEAPVTTWTTNNASFDIKAETIYTKINKKTRPTPGGYNVPSSKTRRQQIDKPIQTTGNPEITSSVSSNYLNTITTSNDIWKVQKMESPNANNHQQHDKVNKKKDNHNNKNNTSSDLNRDFSGIESKEGYQSENIVHSVLGNISSDLIHQFQHSDTYHGRNHCLEQIDINTFKVQVQNSCFNGAVHYESRDMLEFEPTSSSKTTDIQRSTFDHIQDLDIRGRRQLYTEESSNEYYLGSGGQSTNDYQENIVSTGSLERKIHDMQHYLQNNCNFSSSFSSNVTVNADKTPYKKPVYTPYPHDPITEVFTFSTWSSSAESTDIKSDSDYDDNIDPLVQCNRSEVEGTDCNQMSYKEDEETLSDMKKAIATIIEDLTQKSEHSLQKKGGDGDCNDIEFKIGSILHQFNKAVIATEEISQLIASKDG